MEQNIREYALTAIGIETEAVKALTNSINEEFVSTVKALYNCSGRVIISGIGKSGIIAQKMCATFNSTGTPALFMHASDAIHGDLGMVQKNDIVIIISKSGESPEIKVLIPLVKSLGVEVIAITGNTASYLAQHADYCLDTTVAKEACPNNLAPTSSTTAQVVMGDVLSICLIQLKHFTKEDFGKYHPGGNIGKRLFMSIADLYPANEKPSVQPGTVLKDVIFSITKGRLGATAVTDQDNNLLGIITDGDVRRMLETTDVLSGMTAKDIYSKNPKSVQPGTLALDAMEILKTYNVNQLLVADEENRYLGIIHLHDLIREGFK